MLIAGALIGLAAAVAFLIVGALTLFGGAETTRRQLVPGFRPDRPGPLARGLALLGIWAPALLVAALCLLAAIQIFRVALGAIL